MLKTSFFIWLTVLFISCQSNNKKQTKVKEINKKILASLGSKTKQEFSKGFKHLNQQIAEDSTNVKAYLGVAETNIHLYVFGLKPRDSTIPKAQVAFKKAYAFDPLSSDVQKLSAKLSFLDRDWKNAEIAFLKSIVKSPNDLDVRHWYSLFLMATKRTEEAFIQSEIIRLLDVDNNFLIARATLLYFEHRFEEMKPLMDTAIKMNSTAPWGYDWLAMAHNGLNEHNAAIETYYRAFELSGGTVEVTGGLGHALALAGETKLAKEIADYYNIADKSNYLPPVQRSFIHLGLGEYDEAIALLERAYEEESWFLLFMQIEPWYDPIRKDKRFIDIMNKMNFPL